MKMSVKHGITVVIKHNALDYDSAPGGTPRDLQALLLCFIVLQNSRQLPLMQTLINFTVRSVE
jgi:hypothetical protein